MGEVLVNCFFSGVTEAALTAQFHYMQIEVRRCLFALSGPAATALSVNGGSLNRLIVDGCGFVGGACAIAVTIDPQATVAIGPDVCFSLPQESAIVAQGSTERMKLTDVTFDRADCAEAFALAPPAGECPAQGPTPFPTRPFATEDRAAQTVALSETVTVGQSADDTAERTVCGSLALITSVLKDTIVAADSGAAAGSIVAVGAAVGVVLTVAIVLGVCFAIKRRARNEQSTDFVDSEQSCAYTMAFEDDVESRAARTNDQGHDSDDDTMFVGAYGVSDDGRTYFNGQADVAVDNEPRDVYGTAARSAILHRPLLGDVDRRSDGSQL
jgi:hypothetical protein